VRLLFLNENIGGHATVHVNIRRALEERPEVEATFVDVPSPGLLRRLAAAPVPGLARLDADLQPLRYQLMRSLAARRRVPRPVDGFDAVHAYTQNVALLNVRLLRALPSVVTVDSTNTLNAYRLPYRDPTWFTGRLLPITRAFERRVYNAASAIVANNDPAAGSLRETYGVSDAKIHVIPFGVTPPAEPAQLPQAGTPRITFVGTPLRRKGGLRLLELHQRSLRDRCQLTLVTREPVPPAPNVEVIDDLAQGDPRLWDVLRRTSIFVFPSPIDQAPNAVLEAMAAGLPVVALRVSGLPEMVDDGVTGVLVDPDAADDALLTVISSLLDDPDRQARMGAAARQRCLERFDARASVDRLLEVFVSVAASAR